MSLRIITSAIIQVALWPFPWAVRRLILTFIFKYSIASSARIGFSIVLARNLSMGAGSRIASFTICNAIDQCVLGERGSIGTFVYITGYPTTKTEHFAHVPNRKCQLLVGAHSAITSRHFIDCTAGVTVGEFSTVAGIRSQIMSHSINLKECRQDCAAVFIGHYCFVGSGSILLPGSSIPDYCVIGAGCVVSKKLVDSGCLYGGVPARFIKRLSIDATGYFRRETGYVQ
jgi:acetyltransferase-like isoleucine patch superfamily enzyme